MSHRSSSYWGLTVFCSVRCIIVVLSGSCPALWSPCWERESWLLCFSLVCELCTVCHGSFALSLGVIGRLRSVIIALPGHTRAGGGGGGVGGWKVTGVIVVRVCEPVFRNLPHSYTWPLKNGPIHILDRPKCWPIHILSFDFVYPFLAGR